MRREKTFEEIVKHCKQNDYTWTDPQFQPNEESLCAKEECREDYKIYSWIRTTKISKLNDDEYEEGIFADKIEPSDVIQGKLDNSYFLSAVSSISAQEMYIKRIFHSDQINQWGVFGVTILKNGEKKLVVLDNYVPCDNFFPCFSQAKNFELWVILLEKAYAKTFGSYDSLNSGFCHQALRDLTGAPSYDFYLQDHPNIFEQLLDFKKKKYFLCCSCKKSDENLINQFQKVGLQCGQNYSILDVANVQNKNGKNVQLLKLRNPQGNSEWNGDWCDTSQLWTEKLKSELNLESQKDGIFWIDFQSFKQYFQSVQVCKADENYIYSNINITGKSFCLIKFEINEEQSFTLGITQNDEKSYALDEEYEYADVRIAIWEALQSDSQIEGNTRYVKGLTSFLQRDIYIEFQNLAVGKYYMYVSLDWCETALKDKIMQAFSVNSYGEKKIYFQDVTQNMKEDQIVQAALNSYISSLKQQNLFKYKEVEEAKNCKLFDFRTDFFYNVVILDNEEKEKKVQRVVQYSQFQGKQLSQPYKGQDYSVTVSPGEKKQILTRLSIRQYESRYIQSTRVLFSDEILLQEALQKGKQKERYPKIVQYFHKHSNGYIYIYKNDSSDKILIEELNLKIKGLFIFGQESQSKVDIEIHPGEQKIIKLIPNGDQVWSLQTTSTFHLVDV